MLAGRERELAELATFSTSDDEPGYLWLRAGPGAGKTALMSWFALHPPPGVRVVSFFTTARWAGQADRSAFVDNVMEQLLAMLDRQPPSLVTESTREVHLLGLLEEAAHACRSRGERLVLLVDGLDEDQGDHSIAALLPSRLLPGLRMVVADRSNAPLPSDVPDHHILRAPGIVRPLAPSVHAEFGRMDAERELGKLLLESAGELDLLGLIAASGGGLTAADLAELASVPAWSVDRLSATMSGWGFIVREDGTPVYLLAHEELQRTVENMLGPTRTAGCRDALRRWADRYRARGWPENT